VLSTRTNYSTLIDMCIGEPLVHDGFSTFFLLSTSEL